jgi:acyl-CoA dehydrogenase family member 9
LSARDPAPAAVPPTLTSPVKALLAGDVPEELVFPYPEIAPEEREVVSTFLGSFREFAKAHVDPRQFDREHGISPEVVRGLAELGAFGMIIPEAYGGYGFSASAYCRVTEEIGRTDASLGILIGGHQSIGLKGLILFGTEEQKKMWLPSLATGEKIAAFALTEPEAGSDAASIRTTADYDSATDTFLINGSKHWISNGGFAEFFTVFAKDVRLEAKDEHRRITAFVVTKDLGGVVPGPEEKKLGLKGSSTVSLELTSVRVPASHVLGDRGHGFKIAVEILNTGRTSLGAGCIGGSKRMIELAAAQATQRRQFHSRIADFEMIRGKFARMVVNTYALESMVYLTASLIDRGLEDYSLEGACCKVFGTESVWQTINDALQIAGGNGFMEEYPYERALRDSRVNMIFEGTNEILRMLVALSAMKEIGEGLEEVGRALKAPLSSLGILTDYASRRVRRTLAVGSLARVAPELAAEGEAVARYSQAAGGAAETILRKYGKGVLTKEYHQERLANVAIDLYASLAVLSRATSAIERKGSAKSAEEVRLAKLFVAAARHRIVGNLKDMDRNRDADLTAVSETAYGAIGYAFPYWE